MNVLKISRMTTNAEIDGFLEANPHLSRKLITAQARHERRVKTIQHRKNNEEPRSTIRPQYRHSIFDRS